MGAPGGAAAVGIDGDGVVVLAAGKILPEFATGDLFGGLVVVVDEVGMGVDLGDGIVEGVHDGLELAVGSRGVPGGVEEMGAGFRESGFEASGGGETEEGGEGGAGKEVGGFGVERENGSFGGRGDCL